VRDVLGKPSRAGVSKAGGLLEVGDVESIPSCIYFPQTTLYPRRESNSHVRRHRSLRPARLPLRHSGLFSYLIPTPTSPVAAGELAWLDGDRVFFPAHVAVEEFSDVPVAFASHRAELAEGGMAGVASPFEAVPVAAVSFVA
jgi:hypothetical protein